MGFFDDMAPLIGGGLGAIVGGPQGAQMGASVGGSIGAGNKNRALMNDMNNYNDEKINQQIEFQKEMSNTAHQREVKDLQAAGLNPNLSAGGNGSSTPSGASGSAQYHQTPEVSMPDFMAYGMSMKQMELAEARLKLDQAGSAAVIAKTMSDTDLNKMKKILMQKGLIRAEFEGEASQWLKEGLKKMRENIKQPSLREESPQMQQKLIEMQNP